ncbi:MAG: hypothetical protein ACJA1L_001124 [Paracoccaceae bacterium]|jgi:hypothetical protein
MALSHKAKRRWALLLLVVWMPLFVVAALWTVSLFDRPSMWVELAVYAVLGLIWAIPFKMVFLGVGRGEDEAPRPRKR